MSANTIARKPRATRSIATRPSLFPLYEARVGEVSTVDIPPTQFLMIDGEGAPGSRTFTDAIQALYAVSSTLRFRLRRTIGATQPLMPLEALWSADDPAAFTTARDPSRWRWTLMIAQPYRVTPALVEGARKAAIEKKGLMSAIELRLEHFDEGPAMQTLHVGPFANEGSTIERLFLAIAERHAMPHGRLHEIYLSDPSRADPAKLRTIVRQPFV